MTEATAGDHKGVLPDGTSDFFFVENNPMHSRRRLISKEKS
jgi:hypothetical protein